MRTLRDGEDGYGDHLYKFLLAQWDRMCVHEVGEFLDQMIPIVF